MKKTILSLTLGVALLGASVPMFASAATLSTTQVQAVISLLQAFGTDSATIANVQQALGSAQVATTSTSASTNANLIGLLRLGDKGDSVKMLQTILAADPSIYPQGTISGTFGPLTQQALKRYQKKHGFDQLGYIGPKTLQALINEFTQMLAIEQNNGTASSSVSVGEGRHLCAMVPLGHLIAPGWLRKQGNGQQIIPTCQTLPPGMSDLFDGEHTDHRGSTTPPVLDTTAPVISAVSLSGITTTGATVGWTTNENATTLIEFGTTTSYGGVMSNGAVRTTNHSIAIGGLAASTVYHFRITAIDTSNNTATTTDSTFTTLATPDTTAPVISGVSVGAIASTSATIAWTTNENATSKVYFGTTTPLNLSTAATVVNMALVTSHSLGLSSLATSTAYYYVVESKDAANNTATTTQASFTTLAQ